MERLEAAEIEYRMPPLGKPLTPEEIGLFRTWIEQGAPSPADEEPELDPREHWAFRVAKRPAIPTVNDPTWARNPIDTFLSAQYDRHQLSPAPDATPSQRLRRVYLDLIGLPPTPAQLQVFLENPSDEHYRKIVDHLLDSPHYGERWGRHWMDVWRYSDWYGRRYVNDVRNSAPQIWRWREWIVESLNRDKSYARMVQEMIAADEIAAEDDSAWPATGYLIRNYYSLNPNEWMRHNVEYTGKAFLGLTFNCAHCHDHKYDPIAHDDYFRMRAFFEPIGIRQDRVSGETAPPPFEEYVYGGSRKVVREGLVRIFDKQPDATTWFYTGGDERNRVESRGSIPPGVPSFLNVPLGDIKPVDLPLAGWYPGSRPNVQQTMIDEHQAAVTAALQGKESAEATHDLTSQQAQLEVAQREFDIALKTAIAAGEAGALAGLHSVYLHAAEGRRVIQHGMPELTAVPDGTSISFQLGILEDSHINFQLARDAAKHLTALYVGFVNGQIKSYRPGGFSEFSVAAYDLPAGQDQFEVTLVLRPSDDVAELTVSLLGTETQLVTKEPIALNGWKAAKSPPQPMTFDCRPGTSVLIDDVKVVAGNHTFAWDFEAPRFADGDDVDGSHGWRKNSMSVAPATSLVSIMAGCASAMPSYEALNRAKAAYREVSLPLIAATQKLEATRLNLASVEATIAADNARRDQADLSRFEELAKTAYVRQLAANISEAKSRALNAELELIQARALPESDKEKPKRIETLTAALATAKGALTAAVAKQTSTPTSTDYELLSPTSAPQSTGRRAALAYWITDPKNPLTPRVAINHLWMRHFHTPLVESVYDFGRNGKLPSHPQLLDRLTDELLDNAWSMKHIHRLIATSRAYQMSSSTIGLDDNLVKDKDNRLLWRMNQGRMEAEVVRDSLLSIADSLDPTIGGPALPNTQAMTSNRRSLYFEVYPEDGGSDDLADVFDAPDPAECFRRSSTIVPQQALALSNSEIIHRCCVLTADKVSERVGTADDAFIAGAFVRVLSRQPEPRELAAATEFLKKQRLIIEDSVAVRASLIRVLFNHNDFVTIR